MQKLLVSFPATNQESPHKSISLYGLLFFVLSFPNQPFLRINQKILRFYSFLEYVLGLREEIKIKSS
jgi:hypothetical protein